MSRAVTPFAEGPVLWQAGARIAVVGDLQRTGRIELWREQNDAERARVVQRIAEERPAALLILGDLVFDGGATRDWARFDRLTAPLVAAGIAVFPILGNHDCWPLPGLALRHFYARFPHLAGRRFYTRTLGPLGVIALDSNRLFMTSRSWDAQRRFLSEELSRLDADASVRGVVVLVHHPPYTNSTVVGDARDVQEAFVPDFLRARKTLAMLSGHAHVYEHFVVSGRHFVVSGGGGGPRQRLLPPGQSRHPDLFEGAAVRDFHFLTLEPGQEGLSVRVLGLPKAGTAFYDMDRFDVPWPG
jgi:Icc-related predicted phosphoesterase